MKNKKDLTKKFLTATAAISIIMAAGAAWSQVDGEIIASQLNLTPDSSIKDLAGVTSLMTAVANNDLEGVKFFSNASEQTINEKNIGGATAVNIAARSNNIEAAKILLTNKADINIADNEGWTPLMRAAMNANLEMVNLFLQNNADIYALNSDGNGAVGHSVFSDCEKCLENILAKIDRKNPESLQKIMPQMTSAFQIAQNRKNEKAKIILTQYSDKKNNSVNNDGTKILEPSSYAAAGNVKYVLKNSDGNSTFQNSVIIIAPKDSVQVSQIKYERETNVVISNSPQSQAKTDAESKYKFVPDEQNKSVQTIQVKTVDPMPMVEGDDENDNMDQQDHLVSNNVEITAGVSSTYKFKSGSPKISYVRSVEETMQPIQPKKKWAFVVGKNAQDASSSMSSMKVKPYKSVKKVEAAKQVETKKEAKPAYFVKQVQPNKVQPKQIVKTAKVVKSAEPKIESVTVKEAVTFKYIPPEKK